jgi:hypothetical protein
VRTCNKKVEIKINSFALIEEEIISKGKRHSKRNSDSDPETLPSRVNKLKAVSIKKNYLFKRVEIMNWI